MAGGKRSWSGGSVWLPPATTQLAFYLYSIFDGRVKLLRSIIVYESEVKLNVIQDS